MPPELKDLIEDEALAKQVQTMMDSAIKTAADEAAKTAQNNANEGLSNKNKELLTTIKQLKTTQLPDGITKEDIDALEDHKQKIKEEEERIALERGEFDTIKQKIISDKDAEISDTLAKFNQLENTHKQYVARDAIMRELSKNKLSDVAEVLMPHIQPHVTAIPNENGQYEVQIMSNGAVAKTDTGEDKTINHLISEYKANPSFSSIFGGGNAGGNAGGSSNQGPSGENPFKTGNRTEQAKLMNTNPTLAKEFAKAAGMSI